MRRGIWRKLATVLSGVALLMIALAALSSSGAYHCHDVTVAAINIGTREIPEISVGFRNFALGGRSGQLWRGPISPEQTVTMAIETGSAIPSIEGRLDVTIRREVASTPETHEVRLRSTEVNTWVFLIVDDSRMATADAVSHRMVNVTNTRSATDFRRIARLVGCWWQ